MRGRRPVGALVGNQGFDAEARELPGVTHDGITDPAAAPEVVDLIMEALSAI